MEFRVIAGCGDKLRAKTFSAHEIPKKGDSCSLGSKVGEVIVTDTAPGEEMTAVMVTVTQNAFSHLTMADGWSAVE